MGIRLNYWDRQILARLAEYRAKGESIYPYMYGVLATTVRLFQSSVLTQKGLDSQVSTLELLERLANRLDSEELRAIADGASEVPEEDVQSGQ